MIAILLGCAAIGSTPASAQRGPFRVCNKTSETVYLAIAYYSGDKDFFVSEGWWTLNPEGCANVFPRNSYDGHRYYYAENKGRVTTWTSSDGPEVCIDPHNRFKLAHADSSSTCGGAFERQRFHFFRDSDLSLSPPGGPAAAPAPAAGSVSGPGICVAVSNETSHSVRIIVSTPSVYAGKYWDFAPGEGSVLGFGQPLLLISRDAPIKSTNETTSDGRPWFLRGNPYDPGTTSTYDPNFGTERGCRGTVIFTVQ